MPTPLPIPLIDLPFRSNPRKKRRARLQTRAANLPYASQVGDGARMFGNDCGPACVRMALDYLNLAPGVTIDALQKQVNLLQNYPENSDDGTTAEDLIKLAGANGALASKLLLAAGELPEAPAILLVRYNGFSRDSVEDTRYWDLCNTRNLWHWMWWLGNAVFDGVTKSVWNDPLYSGSAGKNVIHTLEEFNAAFLPYGQYRLAIRFEGIRNPPPPAERPLVVAARDADGVNFRTQPTTKNPANLIKRMPQDYRFTVLENAEGALIKLAAGGTECWLRVQTRVDGLTREGYVAAWLMRLVDEAPPTPTPIPTPVPPPAANAFTWQDVINAAALVALEYNASEVDWLGQAGFWRVFLNAFRSQPYAGPPVAQWPLAPDIRQKIIAALALGSDELLRALNKAIDEKQHAPPPAQPRGAIIGVHGAPGVGVPPRADWDVWISRLQQMGARWFKQCENDDLNQREVFEWAKRLKQAGIEPIIRYYVSRQFPNPLPETHIQKMRWYAGAGITWAEIGNEPNLDHEWQGNWLGRVNFNDPQCVALLADGWVRDAKRALDAGVKPAFYALAPTDWNGGTHPSMSSVVFSRRMALWLADNRRADTLDIFRRGGWLAVHCATYEQPVDFNPNRPDGTVWDMSLRGYEVIRAAFKDAFGNGLDVSKIPILSTEGGVFAPESTSMQNRPRLSEAEHARRTVEMFNWLETSSPLMAMCPWCLSADGFGGPFDPRFAWDGWFQQGRALPVVSEMQRLCAANTSRASRAMPRSRPASTKASRRAQVEKRLRELGNPPPPAKKKKVK